MATTSPWSIPLYDSSSPAQLDALLNGQSNALNSALTSASNAISAGANLFKGTAAQRAAFAAATNGQLWQDTNGSMGLYRRQGGAWVRMVDGSATPYAMAAGSVTIAGGSGSVTSATVTFPSGRFTQAPLITLTPSSGVPNRLLGPAHAERSTTGFTAYLVRDNAGDTGVHWIAIQMSPEQSAG